MRWSGLPPVVGRQVSEFSCSLGHLFPSLSPTWDGSRPWQRLSAPKALSVLPSLPRRLGCAVHCPLLPPDPLPPPPAAARHQHAHSLKSTPFDVSETFSVSRPPAIAPLPPSSLPASVTCSCPHHSTGAVAEGHQQPLLSPKAGCGAHSLTSEGTEPCGPPEPRRCFPGLRDTAPSGAPSAPCGLPDQLSNPHASVSICIPTPVDRGL